MRPPDHNKPPHSSATATGQRPRLATKALTKWPKESLRTPPQVEVCRWNTEPLLFIFNQVLVGGSQVTRMAKKVSMEAIDGHEPKKKQLILSIPFHFHTSLKRGSAKLLEGWAMAWWADFTVKSPSLLRFQTNIFGLASTNGGGIPARRAQTWWGRRVESSNESHPPSGETKESTLIY